MFRSRSPKINKLKATAARQWLTKMKNTLIHMLELSFLMWFLCLLHYDVLLPKLLLRLGFCQSNYTNGDRIDPSFDGHGVCVLSVTGSAGSVAGVGGGGGSLKRSQATWSRPTDAKWNQNLFNEHPAHFSVCTNVHIYSRSAHLLGLCVCVVYEYAMPLAWNKSTSRSQSQPVCLFFSSTQSQVSSRSQSQPVCQFFALNMAALPTGKHFDLTEFQKELLKKLQEALVCCDPLTKFFYMVALPPPFASPAPTASISFFGCLLSINFFW